MSRKKPVRLAKLERQTDDLAEAEYETRLKQLQRRLLTIQQAYLLQRRRAVVVLEGTDAAGKGGAINRLTEKLDPRFCHVWPIQAPNEAERKQHYLARFMARMPEPGTIAVFDRSWYGRVLVERVEKLAPKETWKRAFEEIRDFERMMTDDGIALIKLYLHVSAEEQARRLVDRLTDPYKRWKISRRDFESRAFYEDYRKAAEQMMERTSADWAPWHAVAAEKKYPARISALGLVADHLAAGVDLAPPPLDPELKRLARSVLGVSVSG